MSLKLVAPSVKHGKAIAQPDISEVGKLSEIWENDIVYYVVGQTPSIGAIVRFINLEWNHVCKHKVFSHEDWLFLVNFESLAHRNEIFYSGPYTLN